MSTVWRTPLEFLQKGGRARRQEMKDELWNAIIKDETQYLAAERMAAEREGRPPLIDNPFRDAVRRHIIAREKEWLDLDATEELLDALERDQPFGLYLRPYAAEGFGEVVLEVEGGFSISRFVEASTVGRLHRRMQIYGLRNALDFNPLARYRPVWVPPKARIHWPRVACELAKHSKLIVIDATDSSTGSGCGLQEIPSLYPEKTWLLAGRDEVTGGYVSPEVEHAVEVLAEYEEHVSETIHAVEPPQWVRALVESYAPPAGNAWGRRILSYLRRSMRFAL
jgi:hypothetical protein